MIPVLEAHALHVRAVVVPHNAKLELGRNLFSDIATKVSTKMNGILERQHTASCYAQSSRTTLAAVARSAFSVVQGLQERNKLCFWWLCPPCDAARI